MSWWLLGGKNWSIFRKISSESATRKDQLIFIFLNESWFESMLKSAAWISDLNNFTLLSQAAFLIPSLLRCPFSPSSSLTSWPVPRHEFGAAARVSRWGMGARGMLRGWQATEVGGEGHSPPPSCLAVGVTQVVRQGARHTGVLARNQVWASIAPSYLSLVAGDAGPVMFGLCMLQRPELSEENSTYWRGGQWREADSVFM